MFFPLRKIVPFWLLFLNLLNLVLSFPFQRFENTSVTITPAAPVLLSARPGDNQQSSWISAHDQPSLTLSQNALTVALSSASIALAADPDKTHADKSCDLTHRQDSAATTTTFTNSLTNGPRQTTSTSSYAVSRYLNSSTQVTDSGSSSTDIPLLSTAPALATPTQSPLEVDTITSTQFLSIVEHAPKVAVTLIPQSAVDFEPVTSVVIVTKLETLGAVTSRPFPTCKHIQSSINPSSVSTAVSLVQVDSSSATGMVDPFRPIATNAPPSQIVATSNHPLPTKNIAQQKSPLHTNKFYANLFLGDQTSSIFTHPYSLSWANGSGNTRSYGFAIQHVEASQRAFGPPNTKIPGNPASYFINPLGFQTIVMSAKELSHGTSLSADSLDTFSANAILKPNQASPQSIKFPLVQGMGFVTGIYTNLQPQIETGVFFSKVIALGDVGGGIFKWRMSMNDGSTWLMYATPSGSGQIPSFSQASNAKLLGPGNWSGTLQIAKQPTGSPDESAYDRAAGAYPISAKVSGAVTGRNGQYTLTWTVGSKDNSPRSILQYALPHHVQSFDSSTHSRILQNMTLQTTTKGMATAVAGNSWTMTENDLPTDMGFAPWTPSNRTQRMYSSKAANAVNRAAQVELSEDIAAQTNSDSMYFGGKALSKFATIVYAASTIAAQQNAAKQGLAAVQKAMNLYTSNKQQHPLVYDTIWKGIVSSASYNGGDALADFGNTFYNDHHFHYGYFLHTAAVLGSLDPGWLAANKDWVNALARDVNNPSTSDGFFPVFRNYDWYHGHSWAKGLFQSADSKDEESTSEDVMFSYALKMWGQVTGDASMEARGNLMLAVTARSLHNYFLLEDDNKNQPSQYIKNRAPGIMFENKIDHTTYFGANIEYIEGIHMIPLTPASAYTRRKEFVKQEWDTYFAAGGLADANKITGGWKGILYANLALVDPAASFNFFSQDKFDQSWLDGGASRTWYLAFAAGMGGA